MTSDPVPAEALEIVKQMCLSTYADEARFIDAATRAAREDDKSIDFGRWEALRDVWLELFSGQ